MLQNQFTLQDFLEQLQRIKRMGPIAQILGMIPGMSKLQMAGQIDQQDLDKRLKRVEAIINSMTVKERANPKVLNASRRKRIAAGSGTQVRDVNEVLNQFQQMQTMMGQLRKGRMPKGMPNLLG